MWSTTWTLDWDRRESLEMRLTCCLLIRLFCLFSRPIISMAMCCWFLMISGWLLSNTLLHMWMNDLKNFAISLLLTREKKYWQFVSQLKPKSNVRRKKNNGMVSLTKCWKRLRKIQLKELLRSSHVISQQRPKNTEWCLVQWSWVPWKNSLNMPEGFAFVELKMCIWLDRERIGSRCSTNWKICWNMMLMGF